MSTDGNAAPSPVRAGPRALGLVAGAALAAAATVVVLLADDVRVLRLAVLACAWAFVLAALVATRRGAGAGTDREVAQWLAHERDVAVRREQRTQDEGRREVEAALRGDLAALRRDLEVLRGDLGRVSGLAPDLAEAARLGRELTGPAGLRAELGQLPALRGDLDRVAALRADVEGLRREVAALDGLRGGLADLAGLRAELAALADLRTDVGRLRTGLGERASGEMLVERVTLRTQSLRTGPATVESPAVVADPVVTAEPVRAAEPAPTAAVPAPRELAPAAPALTVEDLTGSRWPRHEFPVGRPPAPAEEPRRRRTDAAAPPADPLLTVERPAVVVGEAAEPAPEQRRDQPVAQQVRPPVPRAATGDPGSARLAEILAQNGVAPAGGRRRRRYREDGEDDDVLARVLGRA
ncbi:DUF6779 domain-containing protein [Geodermatophilus marinus]|uniref:DUF6779 domain-containing protein n=1 Tax=Geodermatophilus sp. LHW52908 TaxID=2303986 RepID=UPI000E3EE129|nr:DUF6779 domain-containing protein [Geodermatophilus sp. LHW52908]RFU22202.1 hypothetical protein D0Z06_05860 [Geodermatophilus sp. LHW52908]